MSYNFYKVLHVASLFLLFTALAAIAFAPPEKKKPWAALHGLSSALVLVAGFGLLAKLGLMKNLPTWSFIKVGLWIALGALPIVLRKRPGLAKQALLASVVIGAIGAYTAVNKPDLSTESSTSTEQGGNQQSFPSGATQDVKQ